MKKESDATSVGKSAQKGELIRTGLSPQALERALFDNLSMTMQARQLLAVV